jgi:hypothetical protein
MSKVWYCANCGYEVASRGRCHSCGEKLVASRLPALNPLDEDDEVGYRIEEWEDWDRGRLIVALNDLEIAHRFEDDELVVAAEDEARVDDLISELTSRPGATSGQVTDGASSADGSIETAPEGEVDSLTSSVRALSGAARRLRADPTDMQADADVAEASTAIFTAESYPDADDETWAAVGRVTRRLLSVLGAEEALDAAISNEAGVLAKLLEPLVGDGPSNAPSSEAGPVVAGSGSVSPPTNGAEPDGADLDDGEAAGTELAGPELAGPELVGTAPLDTEPAGTELAETADSAAEDVDESSQTVYELPDWLPEQRAQLGVLLEDVGIEYEWEHDDLVVPSDREQDVESLFTQVGGPPGDEDDDGGEARYHAIEELFAATGRLAGDPADEERAAAVLSWVEEVDGPPPVGMDEVHWLRIMNRAHGLSQAIEDGVASDLIRDEANALHSLLRTVV